MESMQAHTNQDENTGRQRPCKNVYCVLTTATPWNQPDTSRPSRCVYRVHRYSQTRNHEINQDIGLSVKSVSVFVLPSYPLDLQELLDDNGILPLLSDASAGGGGNASLASLVESLSDTILPVNYGVNMPTGGHTHGHLQGHGSGEGSGEGRGAGGLGAGGDAEVVHKDSWQRGETIPANPKERHRRVETGGCAGAFGDREEVDEVDVIMQVHSRGVGREE